jgi:pimeloyl-ACP methyl ester carboxylesterase
MPGNRVPLVFIHGVTSRWQSWLPVMAAFGARWQVNAVDLRGHGHSSHATGHYGAMEYAADIVGVLEQIGNGPAILVGHSLGAIVTIGVAAIAPHLVKAAVLEDPPLAAFGPLGVERPRARRFEIQRDICAEGGSVAEIFRKLSEQSPDRPPSGLRSKAVELSQMDSDVLSSVLERRSVAGYDRDALLKQTRCPVLLLQGNPALDGALDDLHAQAAVSLLAEPTLVYMGDVGHLIHIDQPATFTRYCMEFLESV